MKFTIGIFIRALGCYLIQVAIALDQLVCTLIGGWADETLSSYAYRLEKKGRLWGLFWRPVIDWFAFNIFGQVGHCQLAQIEERNRAQQPPENR